MLVLGIGFALFVGFAGGLCHVRRSQTLSAGLMGLAIPVVVSSPKMGHALAWLGSANLTWAIQIALGAVPVVVGWGLLARWARRMPAPPTADQARLRWTPRPSHRPTWVLAVGFTLLLGASLLLQGSEPLALLVLSLLGMAWWWAHRGQRGPIRVEARELVLGSGHRIPLEEIDGVALDISFLGPIQRSRIRVNHQGRDLALLVSGSPEEDIDAVVRLLSRQRAWAASNALDRPEHPPPTTLAALLRISGRSIGCVGDPPGASGSTVAGTPDPEPPPLG